MHQAVEERGDHDHVADRLEGRVVRIADGDSLTMLDADQVQHRVRLAGIDVPERGQPLGERYGQLVGQIEVEVSEGWCGSVTG
jgi:endonuclease YncB( thermonuclease family)